jgi:hypothetical protein
VRTKPKGRNTTIMVIRFDVELAFLLAVIPKERDNEH